MQRKTRLTVSEWWCNTLLYDCFFRVSYYPTRHNGWSIVVTVVKRELMLSRCKCVVFFRILHIYVVDTNAFSFFASKYNIFARNSLGYAIVCLTKWFYFTRQTSLIQSILFELGLPLYSIEKQGEIIL